MSQPNGDGPPIGPKGRPGILSTRSADCKEDLNGAAVSPRSGAGGPGSTKAVSIIEPDSISPMMLANSKEVDDGFSLDRSIPKQRRAKVAGRLVGRQSDERIAAMVSRSPRLVPLSPSVTGRSLTASPGVMSTSASRSDGSESGRPKAVVADKELYSQIRQWLEAERARKVKEKARKVREKARRAKDKAKHHAKSKRPSEILLQKSKEHGTHEDEVDDHGERSDSDDSEGTSALNKLEELLDKSLILDVFDSPRSRRSSRTMSKKSSLRRLRRTSTTGTGSDTDYFEGVPSVPSCDVVLDNSQTLSYTGGTSDAPQSPDLSRRSKEADSWATFKYEIVRLTHTLRLKGWRRVTMEDSKHIEVERLCGALTNAVYVVLPPKQHSTSHSKRSDRESTEDDSTGTRGKPPPMKLLLRIYGPNVDHLIDREAELAILRRLAQKRIGPRMLGTFRNGRFEEFLNAKALKPEDLRNKETSKQIAKRLRELHDGIELLQEERDGGPFVWKNWDKWVDRCARVCQFVDQEVLNPRNQPASTRRGSKVGQELLCGTTWEVFCSTVERYRKWLEQHYGGFDELKEQLVFAHNDSQYGNILRVEPSGESPLLMPANHHKQLVVIDFEYSNANMPGLEFANHFTEWTYNYHDEVASHVCNTARYPTLEEQRRFIEAYVRHRPQYRAPTTPGVGTPSSRSHTPTSGDASKPPMPYLRHKSSTSSLPAFLLDARTPAGMAPLTSVPPAGQGRFDKAAEEEDKAVETEVQRLLHETKLWRLANSAQWVAWGIVQATVTGLPPESSEVEVSQDEPTAPPNRETDGLSSERVNSSAKSDPAITPKGSDALGEEEKEMVKDLEDKRPDMSARPEEIEELDSDEFDYLAYAHERALFFWGDALQMELIKEEDLPVGLRGRLKTVEC